MDHIVQPRILVLFGTLLGVSALAAVTMLNWLVRKLVSAAWPPRGLAAAGRACVVAVGVTTAACIAYGYLIEPRWLTVERVTIVSTKLPPGSRPIRIVQISDLHSERTARLETKLPQVIAAEHPDLIAFTGDAINGVEGIAVFRECIRRVAATAPTFVTHGTGDGVGLSLGMYDGSGVHDVSAGEETIEVAGVPIHVEGISWRKGRMAKKQPNVELSGTLHVLLAHYPSVAADVLPGSGVDLCLAGNTHGGQVRLPFVGAITGSGNDRKYLTGLYRVDKTWLYVNRGIGMSDSGPAVRFGARPEVTVIEISPGR
jgi:uncharacterized protein